MYIWLRSRSVGAGSATTRNTRGLVRSVIALMVPPLPAPSRPSKTMQTLSPACTTHCCSLTSSPCSRSSCLSYALRLSLLSFLDCWAAAMLTLPFGYRVLETEEQPLAPEVLAELRALHHRQDLRIERREPERDALAAQLRFLL